MSEPADAALPAVQTPTQTSMSEQVDLKTIPISPEGGNQPAEKGADKEKDSGAADSEDKPVTVFHDKLNFNVKHPLSNRWTMWHTSPPTRGKNWNDLLHDIGTFESVEEFWGIFNNIPVVSDLEFKSDYAMFKYGVRPEWEDPQNKHGGKWSYQFTSKNVHKVNWAWMNTILAAIGETLENEDDGEVMGVVVNVRKAFFRVGVWTRTLGRPLPRTANGPKGRTPETSRDILLAIGQRFKEVLELPPGEKVEFMSHTEAANIGTTRAKAKMTI